jgi:DNA-binding transcriptional LysR family regulator
VAELRRRRHLRSVLAVGSPAKELATTPHVTLRQLRYFVALGEELNYRRAAQKLFITQPALSTAIKQLENQFGVSLFTRSTREVSLTDPGAAWLPQVREALHGVDAAVDNLTVMAGTGRGRLRIGYLIGTGADLMFRMVRHFEAAYPDMSIEPTEFDFSDPTAGLSAGLTDVALIRPPVDLPAHKMFILNSEDWVACLPRDHPMAARDEVRIGELLDDPIVGAPVSAGMWRDYWLAMDARGGRAPTVAAVAATYEEETTLIARGLGISFTTESSARLYDRPGIVYVPITDRPPSYTALAWDPATLTQEGELLVRLVQKEWDLGDGQELGTHTSSH